MKRVVVFGATGNLGAYIAMHLKGEGVKADLLGNGITRKPIKVLGHGNVKGIDLEWFDPGKAEVASEADKLRRDGAFTFIFIGRLVGDKGINELVEAFERLSGEHPDTRLILVGPEERDLDPLKPETLSKIKSTRGIEAVGSQSDVRPWLAASDALVFPSYREGFPNVVIEAGAMGLPSIVTDINGSREIIIDGKNGVIIPSHSADALYGAMKGFVTDRAKTASMAAAARGLIASRFEQGYVRKCLKDFYKEIQPK